jgi:folate-binding protein YgfZ
MPGIFFVEDLSEQYRYFEKFGGALDEPSLTVGLPTPESVPPALAGGIVFTSRSSSGYFARLELTESSLETRPEKDAVKIPADLYETLRIENGIPLYGVDMDENTIVPELGLEGMISYNKGCYIGQEIIARIHFRGHVAKQLAGLVFRDADKSVLVPADLTTADGRNAGRITSVTYSPKLEKTIALGYIRYDFLEPGTVLRCGEENVEVSALPFM